jgi:hypothetical protein
MLVQGRGKEGCREVALSSCACDGVRYMEPCTTAPEAPPVVESLCLLLAVTGCCALLCPCVPQGEVDAARPAITICGGRLRGVSPVDSWSPLGQRTAVVVDKVGPISNILPRRPGTPSATPLTAKDAYKYGRRTPAQGRRG